MKIAIDISQIAYQGTGVARYVEQLVLNIVKIDHENQYILYGNSMRQKKALYNFVKEVKKVNHNTHSKIVTIPQTIADIIWNKLHIVPIENIVGEIDVFHASDWVEPPSKKALKVTTIHDLLVFKYPSYFPSEIIDTQKRRISWVLAESDMIIVDSNTTKKDLIELFDYPPGKVEVVYPGISDDFNKQSAEKIAETNKIFNITKPYILSVGTREPRKNVDKTIEAFNKIKNEFDIDLVIAGKLGWGPDRRTGDERIKLLGYVEDKYLPSLYSGASCFVYPSSYEGFGFPILEALASGCPVVTTKGGSLAEVGGSFCTYVEPTDSDSIEEGIKKTLKNNDKNKQKEGIMWARRFKWETTAKKVIEIYNSLNI